MPYRTSPSLSDFLSQRQRWGPEAPFPVDPTMLGTALAPALGWVRSTAPRAAMGGLRRILAGSGETPQAFLQILGEAGGPAEVMDLTTRGPGRSLTQSKALAREVLDYLKGEGYSGLQFSPLADAKASPEARVRLFEYLTGQTAEPMMSANTYHLPLR